MGHALSSGVQITPDTSPDFPPQSWADSPTGSTSSFGCVQKSLYFYLLRCGQLSIFFAGLYYGMDLKHMEISCGLGPAGGPISFHGAFAFSLKTTTTVRYGIPNGGIFFFENCQLL